MFICIYFPCYLDIGIFKDANSASRPNASSPSRRTNPFEPASKLMAPLLEIGYAKSDVVRALSIHAGSIQKAGAWLVEHARLPNPRPKVGLAERM